MIAGCASLPKEFKKEGDYLVYEPTMTRFPEVAGLYTRAAGSQAVEQKEGGRPSVRYNGHSGITYMSALAFISERPEKMISGKSLREGTEKAAKVIAKNYKLKEVPTVEKKDWDAGSSVYVFSYVLEDLEMIKHESRLEGPLHSEVAFFQLPRRTVNIIIMYHAKDHEKFKGSIEGLTKGFLAAQ